MATILQATRLSKIEALLRKAESTEFEAEAEAFAEKAAELMAEWSIEEFQVNVWGEQPKDAEPILFEYFVKAPYAKDRLDVLFGIARAMGCRGFYYPVSRTGYKTMVNDRNHDLRTKVVGFPGDVERVIQMYESIIVQLDVVLNAHKSDPDQRWMSLGEKKVWRASFVRSYGWRISTRIKDAYRRVAETSETSALAVRAKDEIVAEFYDDLPLSHGRSARSASGAGAAAGRQAADNAQISKGMNR
jgi:hypothetical protein